MKTAQKLDRLIASIQASHQAMLATLQEDDEEEDSAPSFEDKLTMAMVRAIKMTRSPSRTFGSNGGYAAS